MIGTVTIGLLHRADDWHWILFRAGQRMFEGAEADGDAALAAARAMLETYLNEGAEAELCSPYWRLSSIRFPHDA